MPEQGWQMLFNGKDLKGWTPKITGYKFGENFGNTFRVKDGAISVSYDGYEGDFKGRFGHLFFKNPYSSYVFQTEYRFVGEQCKNGPGWAYKNSGVMIHGQSGKSMTINQEFPVSSEVQILGGDATGERHTGNLCTPGTNVVMDGKLITQHCTDSKSATYRGEDWVLLEIEVHGSGLVIHRINAQEVIRYEQIQYDPRDADAKPLIKKDNLLIPSGTISLQSESHPVEFRNVRIRKIAN
ncbi:MAG TPA: DUF1080 domain-containing protein [Fimbriimonas sp.]|nr:DUF1080 domain-containing protein [Fimbriimonas sp.]